ncbi:MAG: hypothetical protein HQK76_09640 [Desulfobacterales bacterium]|nr:hypothetical protein [Desulfobacterales bacterium]
MISKQEKLDILKDKNPFLAASIENVWNKRYTDVKSINEKQLNEVISLIEDKAKKPYFYSCGLVLGNIGSGKTHFAAKILDISKNKNFSFAYIPLKDGFDKVHLLKEIMQQLNFQVEGHFTQFDIILSKIYFEVLQKICDTTGNDSCYRLLNKSKDNILNIFSTKISHSIFERMEKMFLSLIQNDLNLAFIQTLFKYRSSNNRNFVIDRIINDTSDSIENNLSEIICSLGELLNRYNHPLILCFDCLDILENDEDINSFASVLEFIMGDTKSILPIIFTNKEFFEEKIQKIFTKPIVECFQNNLIALTSCNIEQALEIIKTRLEFVIGKSYGEYYFPFTKDVLNKTFETISILSPRTIIHIANEKLSEILDIESPMNSVMESLALAFENQYQSILSNFDKYPPDKTKLKLSFILYFEHILSNNSNYKISSYELLCKNKYIDFAYRIKSNDNNKEFLCAFIIDVKKYQVSLEEDALREGINFLTQNESAKIYYIKEKRSDVDKSEALNANDEILKQFKNAGGIATFLKNEESAYWYALEGLFYSIKNGDTDLFNIDSGIKKINIDDFMLFLSQNIFHKYKVFKNFSIIIENTLEGKDIINNDELKALPAEMDLIIKLIMKILSSAPMNIMSSNKLNKKLILSGIDIGIDKLLSIIHEFREYFETIPSGKGVMISNK